MPNYSAIPFYEQPIITVLGPTATGKTKLATQLALLLDAEIISADSRQVYRGMDLGTGKDLCDYTINNQTVKYHLIDIVEPGVEYNVFQYQQAAISAMKTICERNKNIIICGGSGMYIEALLKGYHLFPVPINEDLRHELSLLSQKQLIEQLASFRLLHNHTDTEEIERLIRALEIEYYYKNHPELQEIKKPLNSLNIGLCGDRDLIRNKITLRLHQRLQNGMIEEVDNLLQNGVNPSQLIRYGLEYKFITLYLQKEIDYDTLFNKLNIAIHQFSKRQMTWFRKMERDGFKILWLDINMPNEEKIEKILAHYKVMSKK